MAPRYSFVKDLVLLLVVIGVLSGMAFLMARNSKTAAEEKSKPVVVEVGFSSMTNVATLRRGNEYVWVLPSKSKVDCFTIQTTLPSSVEVEAGAPGYDRLIVTSQMKEVCGSNQHPGLSHLVVRLNDGQYVTICHVVRGTTLSSVGMAVSCEDRQNRAAEGRDASSPSAASSFPIIINTIRIRHG